MDSIQKLSASIFELQNPQTFTALALAIFRIQAQYCGVYKDYLSYLGIDEARIQTVDEIPYLPIEFFKNHQILLEGLSTELVFSSSGTTSTSTSRHYVSDSRIYTKSFCAAFEQFYGSPANMAILALLPSYLEREGSSLIYMVDNLIKQSKSPESGFFLYDHNQLYHTLSKLKESGKPTLLIGVSYALLDFIERYALNFPDLIIMETGGMKGQRKELIRPELHQILQQGFGSSHIHSEYGMTELLSQAYLTETSKFSSPPWMQVRIRDINDPLTMLSELKTGGINVIDLANINSCSFIATQDLGIRYPDGTFEVLGRFDHSDTRGCNLMVQ
ncbi:Acyl-protein synthetase, LuxE [bacterium A37T11]|nr:Acyl-protein synthetase, LuxE [bacterium A37T11]